MSIYCYSIFRVTRKKVISGNQQYLVSISIQKHRWGKKSRSSVSVLLSVRSANAEGM